MYNITQNENVNRAHTSEHKVQDLRRPDRRTPMKVLVEKKFAFVDLLWTTYVARNKPDIRYVSMYVMPIVSDDFFSDQLKMRR